MSALRPPMLVFFIALNAGAAAFYFGSKIKGPVRAQAGEKAALVGMRLPDFALVERSGRTVTRADLEGRPWVANFIYANCPSQCPMISAKMEMLQKTLPEDVGFASFSVDPANDTPEALSAFAGRFHADPERWLFLTGRAEEIEKVIGALGGPRAAAPDAHSLRLYLIDARGDVAGLYDTESDDSIRRLLQDAASLARRQKA